MREDDDEEEKLKPRERDWAERLLRVPPVAPYMWTDVIEMPVVGDFGDLEFAEIVSEGEDCGPIAEIA